MDKIIQHSHSGIMWLAIAMLLVSFLFSLAKFVKKDEVFSPGLFMLFKITKWLLYIQFVLGVVLIFVSEKVSFTSGFMKNEDLRFYGLEHPLMMLIAVGLVSIGLFKSKRKTSAIKKNKTIFIYYAIAMVIILGMVPWKVVLA